MKFPIVHMSNGRAFSLRSLETKDIEPIVRFWYDLDPTRYSADEDSSKHDPEDELRTRLRKRVKDNLTPGQPTYLVMCLDGRAFGHCLLIPSEMPGTAKLHIYVTDPRARNQGFAKALTPKVLETYFEIFGLRKIVFEAQRDNIAANKLLRRLGLEIQSTELRPAEKFLRERFVNVYEISRERARKLPRF